MRGMQKVRPENMRQAVLPRPSAERNTAGGDFQSEEIFKKG